MRRPWKLTLSMLGVAALVLALVNPTPSTAMQPVRRAAVPDTLVVAAGDVSASVSTSPFGLSFRDRSGREVLSSAPGGGTPMPRLHVSDLLGPSTTPTSYRRATHRSPSPSAECR